MASSDAPVSIGSVTLIVNDLENVASFYAQIIGLHVLNRDGETATLGAGNRPLILLRQDAAARRRPSEAGLFHTAFLLPERSDLGSWVHHIDEARVPLDGASDHLVSEALYLQDPEGNGVEVYWDRPRSEWVQTGERIEMDTRPIDLENLAHAAVGKWTEAPAGTVIGHVHLQVGDIAQADAFMTETLGMTKTLGLPSAGWYGSGGYHHHLAANVWKSKGAVTRSANATGLANIELLADPSVHLPGEIADPWGTRFTTTATQARAA